MGGYQELLEIADWIKGALKYFVPLFIIIISILTTWRMLGWGKKILIATNEITRKPGFVIFFIFVCITLLAIWVFIATEVGLYHGVITNTAKSFR
jgi:hypothetical protein